MTMMLSVHHDLLYNHHHPVECLWGIVEWHLKHFSIAIVKNKNPDDHSRVFVSGAIIIDLQCYKRSGAKQARK